MNLTVEFLPARLTVEPTMPIAREFIERSTYVYTQPTASDVWLIEHNMQRYPAVSVVDSAGTQIIGEVQYINENTIMVYFTAAFSGVAYLN